MNLPHHRRSQGEAKPPPTIEMPPTEVESSRTHFEIPSLGLEGQVLKNCSVLRSRTALFFERLKFCWKTPETSRKTLRRPFLLFSFGDRLKKNF